MNYRVRNIGIAVVLAAVAALFTSFYVTNYKRNVQEGEENVTVFVAARDIPAGTPGSKLQSGGMISKNEIARRGVAPGAVSEPDQVRELIAATHVYAGEQITTRRFRPVEERGVRAQISGNQRAIQVPGEQHQLLAGTLAAGDRVDVVASLKYKLADVSPQSAEAGNRGDIERVASRVVLRDLLVLRAPEQPDVGSRLSSRQEVSVLLAVTDSQAQKLFFVLQNGDWSLQLRPVTDAQDSPGSVETIESVMGDGLKQNQLRQLVYGRRLR
jgi:Flp pilus assembly protein CpaB